MENFKYAGLASVFDSSCLVKIQELRVFISGSGLLITELIRNLLLLGFQNLTFHMDSSHSSTPNIPFPELHAKNTSVFIKTTEIPLTASDFENYDLIICSSNSHHTISQYNNFCRLSSTKPGFINCEQWGGLSYMFIDFQDFRSEDIDGSTLTKGYISGVTQSNPGKVYLSEPNDEFNDEDFVIIREVQGMNELNTIGPMKIKKVSDSIFQICDTSLFEPYIKNGVIQRVKKSQDFKYDCWDEACKFPKFRFEESFFEESGLSQQELHFFQRVLRKFWDETGGLPDPGSIEQAEDVVKFANILNNEEKLAGFESFETFDEEKLKFLAFHSKVQAPALATYWAGVVALNILKYFRKFKPIFQWAYEDHSAIFRNLSEKTIKSTDISDPGLSIPIKPTIFIAGAGSVAYEILRIFKLSGRFADFNFIIADGKKVKENQIGSHYIFTQSNAGQYKSEVLEGLFASPAQDHHIRSLNFDINESNSNVFCENFWNHVDYVVDAVIDLKSKNYLYDQILWYEKPAVFHKIYKLKVNVNSCWPHVSQLPDSYFRSEKLIDMKSIHQFPDSYEKCVMWTKNIFYIFFNSLPSEISKLRNDEEFSNKYINNLQQIKNFLICVKEKRFSDCIESAISVFLDKFYYNPLRLLETFPLDHVDNYGDPFWNSKRKPPIAISVNFHDPVQKSFILNFAQILASLLNIQTDNSDVVLDENRLVYRKLTEIEEKQLENELREEIRVLSEDVGQVQRIELELDYDQGPHAEFFYCCCLLRALEFGIEPLSKFDTILMALDISTGLSSVTSVAASLICCEIFKYFDCKECKMPLDHCLNITDNLSLHTKSCPVTKNYDSDCDPIMFGPVKAYPIGFTIWDKLIIPGPLSLESFISYVLAHHNISTCLISIEKTIIFSIFSKNPLYEDQKAKKIESIYQEKGGKIEGLSHLKLILTGETPLTCIDCNIPPIKYIFN